MARPTAFRARDDIDLLGVLGALCLLWLVIVMPVVSDTWLRPAVVIPATVVLPGYALLAGLVSDPDAESLLGEPVARLLFAVGIGVATVILLGIGLLASSVGITTMSALIGVSALTVAGVGLAAVRRPTSYSRERIDAPTSTDVDAVRPTTDTIHRTVAVLVLVAGIGGAAGTVYLTAVHDSPGYAEFSVSPANDGPGGNLTAAGTGPGNASGPLRVRLHHQRPEPTDYRIVALLQHVDGDGTVRESRRVDRHDVTLARNETWTTRHTPIVPWQPAETRVVYRLYRGSDGDGTPRAQIHRWANSTRSWGANG